LLRGAREKESSYIRKENPSYRETLSLYLYLENKDSIGKYNVSTPKPRTSCPSTEFIDKGDNLPFTTNLYIKEG
jgi:hypothetical protein